MLANYMERPDYTDQFTKDLFCYNPGKDYGKVCVFESKKLQ